MNWPGWNRTSVASPRSKRGGPLQTEQPANGAPAECHPRLAVLTRNARSLDPRAACPRRDSNAHCPPQGGASRRWATRTWSRHPVPTRVTRLTTAGPQPCAAANYRGWDRTSVAKVQSLDGMPTTHPVPVREGASRTRKATRFEFARYSSSLHSRMVRHLGLEPRPDTG